VQCHRKYEAEAARAAHSRHKPASSGNRCYNCHMPYTTWGLLKAIRSHQVESPNLTVALQTGRPNACNQCHLDRTLAWTGRYLMEWYGLPNPRVAGDDAEVAASAVWALSGDAGLRALAAWSMGWGPAQEASGTRWMAPILARLLEDPYDAVRFAAYRTARGLAEGRTEGAAGDLAAGFLAAPARRAGAARRLVEVWGRLRPSGTWTAAGPLLIGADGTPRNDVIERLLQRRDTRRIHLNE
jgi:hypothetical protein